MFKPFTRIKDLPVSMRPQEKLIEKGAENLIDNELLAVLLGTGTKKYNALNLAQILLRKYPLITWDSLKIKDVLKVSGVGKTKASRIAAGVELGRRIFGRIPLTTIRMQTVQDMLPQLQEFATKKQEHLVVLYLNARYELLQKEVIGIGSLNTTIIEPKEIFAPAIINPCAFVVIAHNHPSGDPSPSDADILFTRRVFEAGKILGVTLLDHIIVTQNGYFSVVEAEDEPKP